MVLNTYVKFNYLAKVVYELSAIENCRFVPPPMCCMICGVRGMFWAHPYLKRMDPIVFLLGTGRPKMAYVPPLFAGFLSTFYHIK